MKCPDHECHGAESKVKKTLIHIEQMGGPQGFEFGDLKMRVRECLECGKFFETFEVSRKDFERIAKAKHVSEGWSQQKPLTRRPLKPALKPTLDLRRSLDD